MVEPTRYSRGRAGVIRTSRSGSPIGDGSDLGYGCDGVGAVTAGRSSYGNGEVEVVSVRRSVRCLLSGYVCGDEMVLSSINVRSESRICAKASWAARAM